MTIQQFNTIYRALLSLKINCRVDLLHAEASDYRKIKAEQELDEAEKAMTALNATFDSSAILRGNAPCPECGQYIAGAFELEEAK